MLQGTTVYCSFIDRETTCLEWISSIANQSIDEYKTSKTKSKTVFNKKEIDPNVKDKNLLFLGKFGFLVKDYPNENGTWQIQHLCEYLQQYC